MWIESVRMECPKIFVPETRSNGREEEIIHRVLYNM
jgi:hypothetical protein